MRQQRERSEYYVGNNYPVIIDAMQKRKNAQSRLDEIYDILDGLKNHPMKFDDSILRQILECVIVESKERIQVVFAGGLEVEQELN